MCCNFLKYFFLCSFSLYFGLSYKPTYASPQEEATPKAKVELISNFNHLMPDKTVILGVKITLPKGWKTFWKNPGDSGYAATFDWQGSQNLKSATVLWPYPQRVHVLDFWANVYNNQVLFPVLIERNQSTAPLNIKLKLDFLLCQKKGCNPQAEELQIKLLPGKANITAEAKAIDSALSKVPHQGNLPTISFNKIKALNIENEKATLQVYIHAAPPLKRPQLYIEGDSIISYELGNFTPTSANEGYFTLQIQLEKPVKNALASLKLTLENNGISIVKPISDIQIGEIQ